MKSSSCINDATSFHKNKKDYWTIVERDLDKPDVGEFFGSGLKNVKQSSEARVEIADDFVLDSSLRDMDDKTEFDHNHFNSLKTPLLIKDLHLRQESGKDHSRNHK